MAKLINRKMIALLLVCFCAMSFASAVSALAQDEGKIPQRSDIEDKYKWKVEDIYADLAAWEADFEALRTGIEGFEQYKGHLADSEENLLNCLKLSEEMGILEANLYVYAYLKLDEDNRKSEFQELGGRISALYSQLEEAISFIEPEVLAMDEAVLEQWLNESDELAVYRTYLKDMVRKKAHILSPEEEAILAMAGPVTGAPLKIFNMIDNADHKMGSVVDKDGNVIELTRGRYVRILKGDDRELRKAANDTVQASWLKYINTLGATLGASLDKDVFLAKARGYETCLQRRLDRDSIPEEVFHSLIKTVNDNIETLHKLAGLRKKVLGYDTLYSYDLSVPLVGEIDNKYTWEDGKKMVMEGLKPLGETYLADLDKGLNSGWIDVYETEGKGSGAYSWGTYTSHPYVLLNWADMLGDVFTLAHEMGHAMNSYYTNKTEPYVYYGHSMFTAEVASTCNEAILMKYLLANAKTKEEKLVLLDYYIEQIDGTFITQVMFSEFEHEIHKRVEAGDAVSVDYFRKTYRDIVEKYYGPEVIIGENNDLTGMKIYHFYRQYYVHNYATSYAAAQALSQRILDGEKGAVDAYLKFLATGKSKYPVNILKEAGVDMTSPEPFERTMKLFGELIDEMERLLDES